MLISAHTDERGSVTVTFTNEQASTDASGIPADIALRAMAALVQGREEYSLPFTFSKAGDREYVFIKAADSCSNLVLTDDWRVRANAALVRLALIVTGGE